MKKKPSKGSLKESAPGKPKPFGPAPAGGGCNASAADAPAEVADALAEALRNKKTLVAKAKRSVAEWKYATDLMDGAFPLFREISFRGPNKWEAADRRWLPKEPKGFSLRHGLNVAGEVHLVQRSDDAVVLFHRTPEGLDQILLDGNYSNFSRSRVSEGRTFETGVYHLGIREYHVETYEYDSQGRCIRSTERAWRLDDDGSWRLLTFVRTCDYEYDEVGLVRAFDQQMGSEARKLVYQRRGAASAGKKAPAADAPDAPRRPFVAYTFDAPAKSDEPDYPFYSDAYGLAMTIDDEWPIDTVLLYPPERVDIVTESTDVTSMGTVYAGMSSLPGGPALKKAIAAKAQWVLINAASPDVDSQIATIMPTKLNVILLVVRPDQASLAFTPGKGLGAKRLVVAFRTAARVTPAASQTRAKQVREKLREHQAADARVVVACGPRNRNLLNLTSQADVDGVLILEGDYGAAIDILSEMATVLESTSSEPD